jgi:hypothetical protein
MYFFVEKFEIRPSEAISFIRPKYNSIIKSIFIMTLLDERSVTPSISQMTLKE